MSMPQRLGPPAPIGSLVKRGFASRKSAGRATASPFDRGHLAAIRELPCLQCGLDPCGEAHHVRLRHYSMGKRPADCDAICLCSSCHRHDPAALHHVGEAIFWEQLGLNPLLIAQALHAVSPDIARMRAVAFTFIALRS